MSEPGRSPRLVSSPGRFLGQYVDPVSALRVLVCRPADQPELWTRFFLAARDVYRGFGAEGALEWDRNASGDTTALFFAAVVGDRVVAGARAQGPYTAVESAHVLDEWGGHPGSTQVRAEIARRLPAGVIEMKAGWVEPSAPEHDALSAVVARAPLHAAWFLGTRYALCSLHLRAAKRWLSSGGVISTAVTPVAYPDERYRTALLWWDRYTYSDTADLAQTRLLQDEAEQWRQWSGRRTA